jgi:hypothetical protein
VRSEVALAKEPPRLDYLLLRKLTPEGEPVDNRAQTLRHLWPRLPRVSVVGYQSPGHPYRSGQLDRLWGYMLIHDRLVRVTDADLRFLASQIDGNMVHGCLPFGALQAR